MSSITIYNSNYTARLIDFSEYISRLSPCNTNEKGCPIRCAHGAHCVRELLIEQCLVGIYYYCLLRSSTREAINRHLTRY